MRKRSLIIAFTLALGSFLVVLAPNAQAAFVSLNIDVYLNGGGTAVGTANGGSTLDVNVNVGDTVTFRMVVSGQSETGASYATTVTADDPTEIDYLAGSGTDLSGSNFATLKDPDNTLVDPTGDNQVNSATGTFTGGANLYEVDYVVQGGLNADAGIDFSVTLDGYSGITIAKDSAATDGTQTANVRLNGEPGAIIPEPATLLLLGSGLAGLVGFGKRRKRL